MTTSGDAKPESTRKRIPGAKRHRSREPSRKPILSPYVPVMGTDLSEHWGQVAENYSPYANSFGYYALLLDRLLSMRLVVLRPLFEFEEPSEDVRVIGLRHDVDADPITALRAARHLARLGVCGSFYLLHSALYYGVFRDRVFVRNPVMTDWLRGFLVSGCELGLHNDALGIIASHGCDGLQAFIEELKWLRSQGISVRGTSAHNSIPVHGAENFEIFRERVLWERTVISPTGVKLPLGELSEVELGLSYEATFAQRHKGFRKDRAEAFSRDAAGATLASRRWTRRFLMENPCYRFRTDYQAWLLGKDQWVIAGVWRGKKTFYWRVGMDNLLDWLDQLPLGSRTVLVIHPAYVRS